MNCELKLHSKGFYQQILGAVTVLKFLQKLALVFQIFVSTFFPATFLQTNVLKILKKGSRSSSACNTLHFFQMNP